MPTLTKDTRCACCGKTMKAGDEFRWNLKAGRQGGSRARGTHRPDSDADVAVLLRGEPQKSLKVTLAMSDVAYDVLLETGINISPLPVWLDQWERPETFSNPALLRKIASEGVRL